LRDKGKLGVMPCPNFGLLIGSEALCLLFLLVAPAGMKLSVVKPVTSDKYLAMQAFLIRIQIYRGFQTSRLSFKA